MRIKVSTVMVVLFLVVGSTLGADVPLNFNVENRGAGCKKTTVAFKYNKKLPDPFAWADGSGQIKTSEDWSCRRNEIKADLEKYEIGPKPDKPTVTATYSGGSLSITVTVDSKTLTFSNKVTVPSGTGPFPVVIGMGTDAGAVGSFSGCIQVNYSYTSIYTLDYQGGRSQKDGFFKVYPDLWMKVGGYSAWSWGLSRVIDGLELVKDQIKADLGRIAISGCSAAGKMSLFAGALDERVTLTIAQESGGGGIPSWRVEKDLATKSYDCERITNTNYTWFLDAMKNLEPDSLPHDHHSLIAMIAPRAFITVANPDYNTWLCDQGGIISCLAAHEVWKAMGVGDRFGYDFPSPKHDHCVPPSSSVSAANAFIDKFLRGKTSTSTAILNPPSNLKENIADWKDWSTPTITLVSTSIKNKTLANVSDVRCFLNPSNSSVTIEMSGNFSYSLLNPVGQVLKKENACNKAMVSTEHFNGIYFLRVTQKEKTNSIKLVKLGK
jgi:hypothetical protein